MLVEESGCPTVVIVVVRCVVSSRWKQRHSHRFPIPSDAALTILCQGWRSHHVPSCISLVWSDRSITTCRGRPQIGGRHKSLTLALRFRAPDRTLTEDQASAARGAAGAELVGAVQRG